jgi:hypothetical protein
MKHPAGLFALILFVLAPISAQRFDEETAGELRGFERNWLTAQLNDDQGWLSRFSSRRLDVVAASGIELKNRGDVISRLKETDLQANEMKVRISGTISLLTNAPDLNRAFRFLDTFNKIGGRWRVIASSISPIPAAGEQQVKEELLKLEGERVQAVVRSDLSTFERLIAPGFVSTSFDGLVESRQQWMAAIRAHRAKSAALSELQVNIADDTVAVVTGIETFAGLNQNEKETSYVYRFTHTWVQRGAGWQCVASHVTRIK